MSPNNPWKVKDLERLARTLVGYGVQPAAIWKELTLSESALEKLVKRAKIRERLPMLLSMGERKEYKPRFGLFADSLQCGIEPGHPVWMISLRDRPS